MTNNKDFLEKYPELEEFISELGISEVGKNRARYWLSEILDEHFVRKEDFIRHSHRLIVEHEQYKQKVRDAIKKLESESYPIMARTFGRDLLKELGLSEEPKED